MITRIAKVSVYVRDQQKALDFYTGTLGFEVVSDEPMGAGRRWIEVAPPGAETALVLWVPDDDMKDRIGTFSGIVFSADDVAATHRTLRGQGVHFAQEPVDQPGGFMGTFTDPDGNVFVLRDEAR